MTPGRPPTPSAAPNTGRRETLLAFSLMTIFSLSALLVALMPVITPHLRDDAGLTSADIGLLTSSFLFAYALVEFPASIAASRLGGWMYLACGFSLAAGCIVMAWADSLPALVAGRMLQGLGAGSVMVTGGVVIARAVRAERLDYVWGITGAGWGVGTIVGLFLFPTVDRLGGYTAVLLAAAAVIAAATTLVLLQRPVRARPPVETRAGWAFYARGIRTVAAARDVNLLGLFNATSLAVGVAALVWTPELLSDTQDAGLEIAAYVTAGLGLAQIVANPAGAWATGRWGRRPVLFWSQIALAATTFALPFAPGIAAALALVLLVGFFNMTYFPPLFAALPAVVDLRLVGLATAWVSVVGMLSSLLFPWLLGLMLDAGLGYTAGYVVLAMFAAAGAAAVRLLRRA